MYGKITTSLGFILFLSKCCRFHLFYICVHSLQCFLFSHVYTPTILHLNCVLIQYQLDIYLFIFIVYCCIVFYILKKRENCVLFCIYTLHVGDYELIRKLKESCGDFCFCLFCPLSLCCNVWNRLKPANKNILQWKMNEKYK